MDNAPFTDLPSHSYQFPLTYEIYFQMDKTKISKQLTSSNLVVSLQQQNLITERRVYVKVIVIMYSIKTY